MTPDLLDQAMQADFTPKTIGFRYLTKDGHIQRCTCCTAHAPLRPSQAAEGLVCELCFKCHGFTAINDDNLRELAKAQAVMMNILLDQQVPERYIMKADTKNFRQPVPKKKGG